MGRRNEAKSEEKRKETRARERHGIDLCLRRGGGLSAVSYILIFSWRVEANCFGSSSRRP